MSFLRHLLLVVAVFYFTIATISAEENKDPTKPTTEKSQLNIVTRSEWGAYKPKNPNSKLEALPPNYVIISHTGSSQCHTKDKCVKHVRNIQDMHVKQLGWNDIGYNFLVGGDGNVYEGRGWDVEGSHTRGYNAKSIGIAFIGEFTGYPPPPAQLDAAKELLRTGLADKRLASGYKLLGQNQVKATQSPGSKLYEIIKTWEHWVEKP